MVHRLIFNRLTLPKKEAYIIKHGVAIGTRYNGQSTLYLYMVRNFFVEVKYLNDTITHGIEELKIFSSYKKLNKYLLS